MTPIIYTGKYDRVPINKCNQQSNSEEMHLARNSVKLIYTIVNNSIIYVRTSVTDRVLIFSFVAI